MLKNSKKSGLFTAAIVKYRNNSLKLKNFVRLFKKLIPQTLTLRLWLTLAFAVFAVLFGLMVYVYNQHWKKVRSKLVYDIGSSIYYNCIIFNQPTNKQSTEARFFASSPVFLIKELKLPSPEALPFGLHKLHQKNTKILKDILAANLPFPFTIEDDRKGNITVFVQLSQAHGVQFLISRNAFFMHSLHSIAKDTILLYLILLVSSYFLFKLSTAPLKGLVRNLNKFGRGEKVPALKPKGTLEIRSVISAFNKMKNSINRYIEQRTLLLSGISHDLKSSLTRISLLLDLSEYKTEDTKPIRQELANMDKMLSDYLSFAKAEFIDEELSVIDVNTFVSEVVSQYKLTADKKLLLFLDYDKPKITIRANAFRRVITNLLDNALKHASIVHITIKNTSQLILTIEDNGPGISTGELKNVFKPFYRVDNARTNKGVSNSGLGLSIVRDAVKRHGGSIYLSKSKLRGLKVTIILPF